MQTFKLVLLVIWNIFEFICSTIGFIVIFMVLTVVLNGGKVELNKTSGPVKHYCYGDCQTKTTEANNK